MIVIVGAGIVSIPLVWEFVTTTKYPFRFVIGLREVLSVIYLN